VFSHPDPQDDPTASPVAEPPVIVTQLTSSEVTEGGNVTLTIKAEGDGPFTYQWFKGGVEIAGATGSTLELSNVTAENAGSYTVVVSNDDGSVTSDAAELTVLAKPDVIVTLPYSENFDSLVLSPWVSDSESGGDGTDWTATGPDGWVQATGAGHGATGGGDTVTEFDGWTFVDPVTWNATAGQARDQFTKGTGVIAVADSDEFDDKADAKFNASLSTPKIDISGAAAGTVVLTYDSSWRQEPQQGKVTVSFDGGAAVTLLELTPATPTGYNDTVELSLNNPEGAKTAVISWEKQGHNNWWWAIDNISVAVVLPPPALSIVMQAAASVNGPWADVDAPSPLTVPADEAQQYARAVRE